jgi:hypothetical protein
VEQAVAYALSWSRQRRQPRRAIARSAGPRPGSPTREPSNSEASICHVKAVTRRRRSDLPARCLAHSQWPEHMVGRPEILLSVQGLLLSRA